MISYVDVEICAPMNSIRSLRIHLIQDRRAAIVRIASERRLIAAEDAGRYRDALGAMPPSGLPEVFLEGGEEPLRSLVTRFSRSRGPFTTAEANERFGRDVEDQLRAIEREELLVGGELRPGGTEREWCDPDVLRRLRRASLAALRKEVEPAEQATLGRFLPSWHGIDRRATLREALVPLQALSLPVALWEADVLPRRIPGYRPELLDQLCATGEVVWVGAGLDRVVSSSGRTQQGSGGPRPRLRPKAKSTTGFALRSAIERRVLVRPTRLDRPRGRAGAAGALGPGLGRRGDERRLAATEVSASQRDPRQERRPRRFSRSRALADTGTQGRWSLADRLFAGEQDRRALAELLLERQGIVTRDGVRGEGIAGGYGAVYGELKALETLGLCRRGYFVEGLGGAQFALGGAVERLRELRPRDDDEPEPLVLAAADPAQPYGAVLPWPRRAGARAARVAGAYVVLLGGRPALFVERGGKSMVPLQDPEPEWLRVALVALVDHTRRFSRKRLAVERFDGEPVAESASCRSSSKPASSPARAGPSCARRSLRRIAGSPRRDRM